MEELKKLDKVSKEKIEPYIAKCYEELAEYVKAYAQWFFRWT